ncbi:MAG: sigma factor-like helix-turn-helix DNA-binding protein [Minisyncoccia bacterium]
MSTAYAGLQCDQPTPETYFYRAHTRGLLRRFLYLKMRKGRSSCMLDGVTRGWVQSRPIVSFEDAMLFVFDMEKAIDKLPSLDRAILTRVVIQEYTQTEAAVLLGMSARTMSYKFALAMDRLTQILLDTELLVVNSH